MFGKLKFIIFLLFIIFVTECKKLKTQLRKNKSSCSNYLETCYFHSCCSGFECRGLFFLLCLEKKT